MQTLRVGVVGAGVFGTYHAQKAAASPRAHLTGIYDVDMDRARQRALNFGVPAMESFDAMLVQSDAIVVAAPATFHEDLAREALNAGCHALVEKPLSLDAASARALADLAFERKLVLQVGHQERFVAHAMGVLGIPETPTVMESIRVAPPAPDGRAEDVSVIWDLMIHDLDLAFCIFGREFHVERAVGHSAHTAHLDQVETELSFPNGSGLKLMASRDSDVRERRMRLVYPSGEISVDFLSRAISNTTSFDVKVDVAADLPDPLGRADESFYLACLGEEENLVSAHGAVTSVAMAEAIEAMALAGRVEA